MIARELDAQPARLALQIFLPDLDRLGVLGGIDDVLDLVARPRRLHHPEPVFARHVPGLRQDLHHVAVLEVVLQLHDAAVYLGAHAGVADVAMDGVRKIDGRRLARQRNHLAHRRERVNFLRVQIHLERGNELARIAHLLLPLHQLAQPIDALIVRARSLAALFIFPMRGDAFFGQPMHLVGADLHFERPATRRQSRRCAAIDKDSGGESR